MQQIVIKMPEDMWKKVQEGYVPLGISKYLKNGTVLPEHGRLKDVDEIIDKLQNHHDLFISAYNGNFSDMPKDYKARVDEISNCISVITNATTILEGSRNEVS